METTIKVAIVDCMPTFCAAYNLSAVNVCSIKWEMPFHDSRKVKSWTFLFITRVSGVLIGPNFLHQKSKGTSIELNE